MVGVLEAGTMDRPKGANPKAARGRPPAEEKSHKTLGYRVTPRYLKWITAVAKTNRSSIAALIDQAVAKYARDIGVQDAPPDRTA